MRNIIQKGPRVPPDETWRSNDAVYDIDDSEGGGLLSNIVCLYRLKFSTGLRGFGVRRVMYYFMVCLDIVT